MALVLADRVRDTTTTTGTGTVTLSGTAPTGYQNFSVIGNGNTCYYTINAGSQWEVGIGTYSTTGPSLARTTILASSNAGSAVDFAAGTKDVFVTYPAEKSVNYDASNNVGIGTTSPASKLDIATGDLRFSGTGQRILGDFSNATFTNRVCIQTTTANSSTNVSIIPSAAGVGFNASLNAESDPTFASGSVGQLVLVSGSEMRLNSGIRGTGTYLPMTFYTNGSERMRIDTSGNMLVGTTSANGIDKLTAAGIVGSYISGRAGFHLYNGGATAEWFMGQSSASSHNLTFSKLVASTYTDYVTLDTSGNVGIGTTTPTQKLEVNGQTVTGNITVKGDGSEGGQVTLNNAANSAGVYNFDVDGSGHGRIFTITNNTNLSLGQLSGTGGLVLMYTGGSERMRIDSSGNVGIGTSAPGFKLEAVGGIAATSGSNQVVLTTDGSIEIIRNTGDAYIDLKNTTGEDFDCRIQSAGTTTPALTFSVNAAERMRITDAGNVGIGTTGPQGKLDVQSRSSGVVTAGLILDNRVANSVNTGIDLRFYVNDGGDARYAAVRSVQSTSGNYADLRFLVSNSASPAEAMRITPPGNVGIGTTSPASLFHVKYSSDGIENYPTGTWAGRVIMAADASGYNGLVVGNRWAADASTVFEAGSIYGGGSAWASYYKVTGIGTHIWGVGSTGTEYMRLTTSGTLGLGLSAPNASLHIVGARGGEGRLTQMSTSNATAADALNIIASSSSGGSDQWYSWGVTSGNVWRICPGVGLGSSEAFSINSNSRVMVGSATTFDTTVGANFMSYGSAGSAAAFKVNATSSTQVSFYDSTQSARVGWIGTSGSSTSYNTTSDRRLKKNIQPVGDVGDKIDQIEVVSHEWTNGTDAVIPYAFIAQDLYEAAPHAVSKGDDGEEVVTEWAVDYSKLVPMLVKEIQSLRTRVAQLEGN